MKGNRLSPEEKMKMIQEQNQRIKENMKKVKYKILVLSGKGGVGKTTVAVNLSVALQKEGYKTGILDVDIHGPNVPKMLGMEREKLIMEGGRIIPPEWNKGLKVISMAFLLQGKDTPVIWRGPLKASVIRQFLADVEWGELDFLVVDSPPGTGDEPLSILQLIPQTDIAIVVTTPQDVALLDSRKAVRFARELGVKKIGLIENMRGFICPHCGKEIYLFKKGGGERSAKELGIEFLGYLPLDVSVVECGDEGIPVILREGRVKEKMIEIIKRVEEWLN
ncbi:Mrp/NBP35 family ATP-binding protein [Candidatus Calescamantes bacterium]|nr:Mrp/NBP35 family ATP-binding protein [Candidatus Calescamantes bacterium]